MIKQIAVLLFISLCFCDEASDLKQKLNEALKAKVNSTEFQKIQDQPVSKLGMLNSVLDAYSEIKNAFKTTFKSTIIKEISDRGFENLDLKTNVVEKLQYHEDNLPDFLDMLVNVVHVPEDKQEEFMFQVVDFPADQTQWTGNENFFNTQSQTNQLNFVQVFMNQDLEKKGTINIIVVDVQGTYGLADDIIIKQKSSSYVGGIFNKEELIIEKKPKNLTQQDMNAIMQFFKFIATNAYLSDQGITSMAEEI